MAYDEAREEIVVFGGRSRVTPSNETWVWNGTNWVQKFPAIRPPARSGAAMAYDAIRQNVVLFGGYGAAEADTWIWDGTNWSKRSPAQSPPLRTNAPMVYDRSRGFILLFGGAAATGGMGSVPLDDTWKWDGQNWARLVPLTKPQARSEHAMVFDGTRGQVVMFGGNLDSPSVQVDGETWLWTGEDWVKRVPASRPTPRSLHGMAFDHGRGVTLLFGGNIGALNMNDTWSWDGSNWTQEFPATSPPPGWGLRGIASDANRKQVVYYTAGRTWVWSAPADACPAKTIFPDLTGTAGFTDVAVTNIRVADGITANVRVDNSVTVWRGVTFIDGTMNAGFSAENGAGPEGVTAGFNLLPPCSSNLIRCTGPGRSTWVGSFCAKGTVEIAVSMTSRAAAVTMAEMIIVGAVKLAGSPVSLPPLSTVVNVADRLYTDVPAIRTAVECAVNNATNTVCITKAFGVLAHDDDQRDKIESILRSAGVNIGSKAIVGYLLKVPVSFIQALGTLTALQYETTRLGHPGVESIKLNVR